jgi:hypothetical protein
LGVHGAADLGVSKYKDRQQSPKFLGQTLWIATGVECRPASDFLESVISLRVAI